MGKLFKVSLTGGAPTELLGGLKDPSEVALDSTYDYVLDKAGIRRTPK